MVVCVCNTVLWVCTHVLGNNLCACLSMYREQRNLGNHRQADIWPTCPADLLGLFVTRSLWESMWLHLFPLLSRCDSFVTKEDSQSDICGQFHVCAARLYSICTLMHRPHIHTCAQFYTVYTLYACKLCQVLTGCVPCDLCEKVGLWQSDSLNLRSVGTTVGSLLTSDAWLCIVFAVNCFIMWTKSQQ